MRKTMFRAACGWSRMSIVLAGFACSMIGAGAGAQTIVDCTGATSGAYTTITAALAGTATMGANIEVVAGPCNEKVNISNRYSLNLGAQSGKTVVLNGLISVQNSENVYIYGFDVTNPNTSGVTNGIVVVASRGVTLDTVTSSGNKNNGLVLAGFADVELLGPATFQNNGSYGVVVQEGSALDIETSAGALTVSNDGAGGFFVYLGSVMALDGNATIENNGNGGIGHQAGIAAHETSNVQLAPCTGNITIQGNAHAGIEVQGTSGADVAACGAGYKTLIENNGVFGAESALDSAITINSEAQISGNPSAGILVDGAASLYLNGPSLITKNGTVGNIDTAGVVVTNNSAVEADNANVNANLGWGFAASLGGNLHLSGDTVSGNLLGVIGCDSSSNVFDDFPANESGIYCATPTIPGYMPLKPLNETRPERASALKQSATEPPDPAALAEKARSARAAFWKAMNGAGARPE
jgi:hypothetical protein